jgi:hypothetical protein
VEEALKHAIRDYSEGNPGNMPAVSFHFLPLPTFLNGQGCGPGGALGPVYLRVWPDASPTVILAPRPVDRSARVGNSVRISGTAVTEQTPYQNGIQSGGCPSKFQSKPKNLRGDKSDNARIRNFSSSKFMM